MKSIIVALTTLATVALAQDTAGLEQCAVSFPATDRGLVLPVLM